MKQEKPVRAVDFIRPTGEYEYWYCPECGRVHQVENNPRGKVVDVYSLAVENKSVTDVDNNWEPFYVFSDNFLYEPEARDDSLNNLIRDYGDTHLYKIDPAFNTVCKIGTDGTAKIVYCKES